MPKLVASMNSHTVITPYSFDLQKYNKQCCQPFRTPVQFRELAMQRHPCPIADPSRKGHFLLRCQALNPANDTLSALTDLSYLPSINQKEGTLEGDAKKEAEKRKSRDAAMTVKSGLKSWNVKTVRAFLVCYNCGKRRCVYSAKDA